MDQNKTEIDVSTSECPELVNLTLFGKRVFTEVIKESEMRSSSWSIWAGLQSNDVSFSQFPPVDLSRGTAAAAKSLQSCPTLCDPIDGSPPGSPVPEILQARTLEWAAISFSNVGKWKVKVKSLSRVRLPETPWTAAHQAPPSVGFSRQEDCSGRHRLLRCNIQ